MLLYWPFSAVFQDIITVSKHNSVFGG